MATAGSISSDILARAEAVVGYEFVDRDMLTLALTHASSADDRLNSNERLEFLGDAVLGMVVCEYLYERFPELQEGDLTKIKSNVVSRETCARVARDLGLEDLVRLGKGMSDRGEIPGSLVAGAFEAVIGALFLDAGMAQARDFIRRSLESAIGGAARSGHQHNFKSVLQQITQQNMTGPPDYLMLDEKGPDHAKCFEVSVRVGSMQYPSSWGRSKKRAEQQAALNALVEMGYIEFGENEDIHLLEGEEDA